MINPGTKFTLPDYIGGEDALSTLVGKLGSSSAPFDPLLSIHIYRLMADAEDRQGPHDQDELYLVLEGERTCEIYVEKSDKTISVDLKPMDLIYVPKDHPHRFVGSSRFVTLVLFTPEFTGQSVKKRAGIKTRDQLINVLRQACQLEHGLLVQYLFAAFSLVSDPDEIDAESWEQIRAIREQLLLVARQEMAHLGTVANLMVAIGATPDFSLPPFPQKNDRWFPFPFCLESLTLKSIERFIRFEEPELDSRDTDLDHIGELYRAIYSGFETLSKNSNSLFIGNLGDQEASDWGAGLEVYAVRRLEDVESAIRFIIEEGEGSSAQPTSSELKLPYFEFFSGRRSHYERFIYIRKMLKSLKARGVTWHKEIIDNPATSPNSLRDGQVTLISDETSLATAKLFNHAYESLLLMLTAFYDTAGETKSEKELIHRLLKGMMSGIIRPLAEIITALPASTSDTCRAAPTFEIGTYLTVAPRAIARWIRLLECLEELRSACKKLMDDRIHERIEFVFRNIDIVHSEIEEVVRQGGQNA